MFCLTCLTANQITRGKAITSLKKGKGKEEFNNTKNKVKREKNQK